MPRRIDSAWIALNNPRVLWLYLTLRERTGSIAFAKNRCSVHMSHVFFFVLFIYRVILFSFFNSRCWILISSYVSQVLFIFLLTTLHLNTAFLKNIYLIYVFRNWMIKILRHKKLWTNIKRIKGDHYIVTIAVTVSRIHTQYCSILLNFKWLHTICLI